MQEISFTEEPLTCIPELEFMNKSPHLAKERQTITWEGLHPRVEEDRLQVFRIEQRMVDMAKDNPQPLSPRSHKGQEKTSHEKENVVAFEEEYKTDSEKD